jgi:hypothetical protein
LAIKNINSMKEIYIAAPVATRSGYGAHSREIVKALIKSGKYDVKIIPLRWGGTPQTALDKENPEDQLILNNMVSGQLNGKPDVFLHITIPNEFQASTTAPPFCLCVHKCRTQSALFLYLFYKIFASIFTKLAIWASTINCLLKQIWTFSTTPIDHQGLW